MSVCAHVQRVLAALFPAPSAKTQLNSHCVLLSSANYSDIDPDPKTRPNAAIRIFDLSLYYAGLNNLPPCSLPWNVLIAPLLCPRNGTPFLPLSLVQWRGTKGEGFLFPPRPSVIPSEGCRSEESRLQLNSAATPTRNSPANARTLATWAY